MATVIHTPLKNLAAQFRTGLDHLVVSASYEERSHGCWSELRPIVKGRRFVCFNGNHIGYLRDSVARFHIEDADARLVDLNSDNPLTTFRALQIVFRTIAADGPSHVAVDITGFTREALAMLIYVAAYELPSGSTLTAVYQRAAAYASSRTGGWLSQGVREIRNIVGYPGIFEFGADSHLVLIPGLEFERARQIIDAVRPIQISVGRAVRADGDHQEFDRRVEAFIGQLQAIYPGIRFREFAFATLDPFATRDHLKRLVCEISSENVICACLNAKPSTVGVCLAAIDIPTMQLIYAQPICYNVLDYSQPSKEALMFEVPLPTMHKEFFAEFGITAGSAEPAFA